MPVQFLFGSFTGQNIKTGQILISTMNLFPGCQMPLPIRFELHNRILPKDKDNNILKINQFGTSCDYRNLNQLYNRDYEYHEQSPVNSYSVACSHEAEYTLDLTSLMVQKATAHFKIQIGDVTEQDIFTIEKQLK